MRRALRLLAGAAMALAIAAPSAQDGDIVDHFKYGSVGIEENEGVPYWIWRALPEVFGDLLPAPGGYASLGFVQEAGHEDPIGFSRRPILGMDRIAINCAFCHAGTFRRTAADTPLVIPGAPSTRINPQGYARFLQAAAQDPRFTAGNLLAAIDRLTDLSFFTRLSYRFVLIPGTRRALRRLATESAWMDSRPDWGPGRIDPFNPVKFRTLQVPLDDTIGNSDMMPIWRLRGRDGLPLHWDGLSTSLRDVMLSSAIGDGASRRSIDLDSLGRLERWLVELEPPAYPYPIDAALAARGNEVFAAECAACHAPGGARLWTLIPIDEVGTDRHRLDMWTQQAAEIYNAFADGYPWDFSAFRKTAGYLAGDLAGLWVTAPYLHNGSVPSLVALLQPPAERPTQFYRGSDVYDPAAVGFVSAGSDAEAQGFRYDTSVAGNSSAGHLFGTMLPPDDKTALIEYLKTR